MSKTQMNSTLSILLCLVLSVSGFTSADAKEPSSIKYQDCGDCPVLVGLPTGSFLMGTPKQSENHAQDETPQHKVTINYKLAVGKYEITKREYSKFITDTGKSTSGGCFFRSGPVPELNKAFNWLNPGYAQSDDDPAVCVSWNDASEYVRWLSKKVGKHYRLLSEAEWEYAARGNTTNKRHWGDSANDGCEYANGADLTGETDLPGWTVANCADGHSYTAPVGSLLPNSFGLHDMLGNVAEWVADCWNDNYVGAPADGTAWMNGDCSRPILRGASWHDDPKFLRSANRYGFYFLGNDSKNARYRNFGFRVARKID